MCGDYWVLTRESLINIYEETLVKEALNKGYNVIIDATNLNPKTITKWTKIASDFDCDLRFKEFIIPYMEAIKRDKIDIQQQVRMLLEVFILDIILIIYKL